MIWIGVAVCLAAAYFALPNTPESKLVLYNGLGLLSILALLVGVKVNNARPRAPWMWFAAGLTSFLAADVIYYVIELTSADGVPFPNLADFFYLMMYPLMIVGLTKMVRAVAPGRDAASFIDAAIVAIAMFGALWVLFVDTVWTSGASTEVLLVSLGYPVMDVALMAVAARLVVTVHLRHPPFALILVALASLAIADTSYNILLQTDSFRTGLWVDAFWLTFYVGFGAAALHPAASAPVTNLAEGASKLTPRQLLIMFFATLGLPLIDLLWGTQEDRLVIIVASAMLSLLILLRVYTLMGALQRGQDRLRHDAEHDALTGLSNRVLFAQRTEHALLAERDGHVAVLFIDLDDFKTVNDSLGHQAGDEFLAEVARRFESCVEEGDTIARFGGDEFAMLLENVADKREAMTVARRALEVLVDPIDLGSRSVQASASIGIAVDLGHDRDVESLLRNADVAMYLSKSRGKGRFEFFEPEMHEEAIERLDLKADLQFALDNDEFVLHYQPIFDLQTGKPRLAEALVRWRHHDRGMIMPDRFISLAEETGLIVPLGEWVLREACSQARRWQEIDGLEDMGITVNLSMRQLQDPQLVNSLTRALQDSGLEAKHLVLEITESMLALDAEQSAGILGQLKTIGVKLAIDDFGTGYSSLSYLRSFSVDSIKIDRSFINELHRSSTSTALVEAVVNLSQALGAYTVAEGIEHSDQASLLRKLGCERGQGFYYCRPLTAAALTSLLKEHASDDAEPLEAWRRSSEKVQERTFDVEVRRGLPELRAVGKDIIELNEDLNVPVMASWPWLANWAEAFENWEPMMIAIRSATTDQLMAAAFLATMERAEGNAIVAMGHGSSLFTALQARDTDSAAALASAVVEALHELDGVWVARSRADPRHGPGPAVPGRGARPRPAAPRAAHPAGGVLHCPLDRRRAQQEQAQAAPSGHAAHRERRPRHDHRLRPGTGHHRRAHRRGRGRARVAATATPAATATSTVPPSASSGAGWWRPPTRSGEIEIASLRLDGELAAYVVAILDGDTYRVYDGRMSTTWQHYSPGRLVEGGGAEPGHLRSPLRRARLDVGHRGREAPHHQHRRGSGPVGRHERQPLHPDPQGEGGARRGLRSRGGHAPPASRVRSGGAGPPHRGSRAPSASRRGSPTGKSTNFEAPTST